MKTPYWSLDFALYSIFGPEFCQSSHCCTFALRSILDVHKFLQYGS
uniref:Uncharacterized protein n=1 Tax=Arundo donax TaxID=35708 RepID=A0A0A8Y4U1_ARUDO